MCITYYDVWDSPSGRGPEIVYTSNDENRAKDYAKKYGGYVSARRVWVR